MDTCSVGRELSEATGRPNKIREEKKNPRLIIWATVESSHPLKPFGKQSQGSVTAENVTLGPLHVELTSQDANEGVQGRIRYASEGAQGKDV